MPEASVRGILARRGALALGAYAALAVAAAFHFSDQINPDGVAYLRIAGYYGSGELSRAVSAYWSPLYSWLLAPWVALGVPALLATKLLGALLAVAWVHGVGLLAPRYVESAPARALLLAATAVGALAWSMWTIAPDLLLAVLLTYYFHVVAHPALTARPGRAFASGLLGGLAYLAKAYALPFFLAHFLGTIVLAGWARADGAGRAGGARWRDWARAAGAGLLGFALLAGVWVAILSVTQGRLTLTTAVSRNEPIRGDHSVFLPFALRLSPEQRLSRVEPGRLTTWETPDRFRPTSAPLVSDPAVVLRGWLRELAGNLITIRDRLSGFDYFHLAIPGVLGAVFLALLRRHERGVAAPEIWGAFTIALYAGGYLPLVATEERYFWPLAGLLLVLAGGCAEKFARAAVGLAASPQSRPARLVLAAVAVVALSFFLVGAQGLVELGTTPRPEYRSVARRVAEAARRNGTTVRGPIAGNEWPRTLYTAYAMSLPMAGVTTSRDPAALADEMAAVGVRLYLVFDDRTLAAQIRASGRFRHLGDITPRGAPGTVVAAFELSGRNGCGVPVAGSSPAGISGREGRASRDCSRT